MKLTKAEARLAKQLAALEVERRVEVEIQASQIANAKKTR